MKIYKNKKKDQPIINDKKPLTSILKTTTKKPPLTRPLADLEARLKLIESKAKRFEEKGMKTTP